MAKRQSSFTVPSTEVSRNIDSSTFDIVKIVADNINNVVLTANNMESLLIVSSIEQAIKDLSDRKTKLDSLYSDKEVLDSLYADKSILDSLYNDKATLDSLYADKNILDTIFNSKGMLDSIYADKTKLDSLYADKATLDSLYNDKTTMDRLYQSITNIDRLVTSADNIDRLSESADNIDTTAEHIANIDTATAHIDNIDTTATHISSVDTVATSIANVNTIADNVNDVTYFADIYQGPKSEAPTTRNDGSVLQNGDLYFQIENDDIKAQMMEYDATNSVWLSVGSTVNGTSKRETFTAEADQTEFTITGGYDASYADVFLNGRKLVNSDEVDVSDGTKVVLSDGASEGDIIDVVAYGTFSIADTYSRAEADDLLDAKLTISDLLEKIKEVDGTDSGLDADLLRGLPADFYLEVGDNYVLQRFPSGLIHLHCIFTSTSDSSEDFTFPIAFPNNALIAHLTAMSNDGNADIGTAFGVTDLTATGFSVDRDDDISGDRDFSIFIIGN